jgi:hypothetical protein
MAGLSSPSYQPANQLPANQLPANQLPFRPAHYREKMVKELLAHDVIEESESSFVEPPVREKEGRQSETDSRLSRIELADCHTCSASATDG